jgi:hypothetical protein
VGWYMSGRSSRWETAACADRCLTPRAADAQKRPLRRRFRFQAQLTPSVRASSIIRAKIMDQSAMAQLDIIRQISDALTCAGVDHWLFGGWAVDFAVGEMTR